MAASVQATKLDYGIGQELLKQFYKIVSKSLKSRGNKLISEFSRMPTDVQRVYYLLEIMRTSHNDRSLTDMISKEYARELLKSENGKSDEISRDFLAQGIESMRKNDKYMALYNFTKAVFHAASKEQLALSMTKRSEMLFNLSLFESAKEDVKRALPFLKDKYDILTSRVILGRCYNNLEQPNMANREVKRAATLLKKCEQSEKRELMELEQELSNEGVNVRFQFECHRPKFFKIKPPEKLVRFKNTGTKRGWITEVTRDVVPLEVLFTTKPILLPLSNNLTKYCYVCQKRCHNLLPCKKCALVGFCSKKCAKIARKNKRRCDFYPNRHKYDCYGLLPVIFNCLNFEHPSKPYRELSHAAFMCVANTKRSRLLEYICSVKKYKKGKGHPAFVKIEEVRKTAPPLWNNLDYASVAWVNPHSDEWNTVDGKYGTLLLDYTIAAVFLTFCLHLGGYPMDWSYSKQANIKMNISDKPPASWIGGCLLYHLQSTRINSFGFYDVVRSEEAMKYEDLSSLIYPPLSLINHSCDPSALVLITSEGVAFLMSIRDLKAGNEITISYQVAYEEKNTRDRKRQLKENYFFECTCEACQNNWNNENPVEKVKCPRCQFGSELIAQTAKCSKCESVLPTAEAYKLISDVRALIKEIPNISWNRKQSQNLSSLLTRAYSLLSPPCRTITLLRQCIFDLLKKTAQMWTCEPWLGNYYKCIAAEESSTLKKERRMILN